jgi:hypothetical protein
MTRIKKEEKLPEEKKTILQLLNQVKTGEIKPAQAHAVWDKIYGYKEQYIKNINSQSWNSFIGGVFEELVYSILKNYISQLSQREEFKNICLFTEDEIKANDYLHQKLSIMYGPNIRILPDTDMAVVDYYPFDPNKSKVVAIISCKTSLRERIAQACYWKLKLVGGPATSHVKVLLATSDNDEDFALKKNGERSRDRIIAEYELDGIYILRGDFKHEWESKRVKQYKRIFDDLVQIFRRLKRSL